MVAISSVLGGLSLLPEIVKGVDAVIGLFQGSGQPTPSTAVSNVAPSGSGIGAIVGRAQAGTSVGPVIGQAVDVGLTVLPPIIAAIRDRSAAPTGLTIGQPQTVARQVVGSGLQTMTRRSFILATAKAANPGATAKKILRSARECGIELAAATFGLNVLDVCFLIAQPPTRRSRGISAADIRRTRSTMRKINSLKNLCPPARRSRK